MALLTACKLAAASFDTYFVGEGDFTIVCWSDVLSYNADWSLSLLFSHTVDLFSLLMFLLLVCDFKILNLYLTLLCFNFAYCCSVKSCLVIADCL